MEGTLGNTMLYMIPQLPRGRSQLRSYINKHPDGSVAFGVSSDVYPELFEHEHRNIVDQAPEGWKTNDSGNMQYLWFPPNQLSNREIRTIETWKEHFEQYVLLGRNDNIRPHFSTELDFCMALDFTFDEPMGDRTEYGEAEYQFKYNKSEEDYYFLIDALSEAF